MHVRTIFQSFNIKLKLPYIDRLIFELWKDSLRKNSILILRKLTVLDAQQKYRVHAWVCVCVRARARVSTPIALSSLVVSGLAIRPKVCGFRPGRGRWPLKGDKIHRTPSERKNIHRHHVVIFYDMLQNPTCMKTELLLRRQNSRPFLARFLLIRYKVYLQVIVREFWYMTITQIGTHNRSEMVSVHGTPCAIPPSNNNNSSKSILSPEHFGHLFKMHRKKVWRPCLIWSSLNNAVFAGTLTKTENFYFCPYVTPSYKEECRKKMKSWRICWSGPWVGLNTVLTTALFYL
jgi:hypothetical protein